MNAFFTELMIKMERKEKFEHHATLKVKIQGISSSHFCTRYFAGNDMFKELLIYQKKLKVQS
jgi:hypothetical protein